MFSKAKYFIYETSYDSNAIEGNSLSLDETISFLKYGVIDNNKNERDYIDISGFKEGFYYVYKLAQENNDFCEGDILDIHSLVLKGDDYNRGRYRNTYVRILGANTSPSDPYLIVPEMEDLFKKYKEWLNTKHIIEAVALFHLWFESIHPFSDGNGRTGRLILNLELIKNGLLPINIKFLEKDKYYDAFNSYNTNKNTDDMINLIAKYEIKELENRLIIAK